MKQVKLSDILESVAAKYESGEMSGYSCNRVWEQMSLMLPRDDVFYDMFDSFADGTHNMGLDYELVDAFYDVDNKQQARSLWLTWCAMMARKQGL